MARLFPMVSAETKTRNFTANGTWTAPLTTSALMSSTGQGAAGSPASSGTVTYREDTTITLYRYPDGTSQAVGPTMISRTFWDGQPLPADYCEPEKPYTSIQWPSGATSQKCYYFKKVNESFSKPATTGASATFAAGVSGSSRTFPGGYAGPASPVTYDNVPVVPGQTYNLAVPAGGSITITYLE